MSVPTCVETECLAIVCKIFQQTGCEQIIIVDQQQSPIGVLHLRHLLIQFPNLISLSLITPELPAELLAAAKLDTSSLQQSIKQLGQSSLPQSQPLLEPLTAIPTHWNLEQFQPFLQEVGQRQWALVDGESRTVGLLDRLRLLQFLAVNPSLPHSQLPSETLDRADSPITILNPLVDLLERLPIPLMLQTTVGRVITQNLAWRQQVGELQDPGQVRQEAALILESAVWQEQYAAGVDQGTSSGEDSRFQSDQPLLPHLAQFYFVDWDNPDISTSRESQYRETQQAGFCRVGSEPNACVCVCPMKSGQARVWQFIKIPMGTASPDHGVNSPSLASLTEPQQSTSLSPFKLGTLSFSPDPAWRSLVQTETLWLVLAQDMTEEQQVAKELAAKNADLVQLNRLKDEFLACISHELKTPLTAVLGLSSLLKDHLLGELNERQSRYARLIYQSGRHLVLIINDILDLTRIETGQLELTLEPVQIEMVCKRAYEQARQFLQALEASAEPPAATNAEIRFTLEIQPGLENLIADELRLRQMLSNLLSNALKFTESNGTVELKVEAWEGWIAFTVSDTGIGIPADKQHLIFQKFQQLENPLTRQFEGTGLGLVLTQRLARLHGGDVTFTSVDGEGSQFTLLLPPSPPQVSDDFGLGRAVMNRPLSITSNNRLVLVVEADPHLVEDLTNQLVGLGYRVAIARSGTEALEKIRRLQPGAVFLNPLLPMLSGWDVLTLLKTDEAIRHVPIVVTAVRVEKDQAYKNGADGFLSLPVQVEALQRCLDRLINQTPSEPQPPQPSLTVLYLHESSSSLGSGVDASIPDLSDLLHPYHCRVLEVDDLEQADLLAQVWKPDVILLSSRITNPAAYLKQLSQHPFLTALPVVTLTTEMTQIANQISGLAVFPCLTPPIQTDNQFNSPQTLTLLQALQIAAGISWTPHILIIDTATLQENGAIDRSTAKSIHPPIQALVQYMQAAGFRSSIGNSWQTVSQKLQHQSVDLLLFCVDTAEAYPQFLEIAQTLEQLPARPPILVWNYQTRSTGTGEEIAFEALWRTIADQILPPSLSMVELLAQVNKALQGSRQSSERSSRQ